MLRSKITKNKKDPLGTMLLDYLAGRRDVYVEAVSADMEIWRMAGRIMFRRFDEMDILEKKALGMCSGRVLDVGAGSGCHSLVLQEGDCGVESLDISPGCIEVMHRQGVKKPLHANLFALQGKQYDTILMLMNGMGICGSVDGCNLFFQFAHTILAGGGKIIADSTDILPLREESPYGLTDYPGETEFVMHYGAAVSAPFPWVYIDYQTLAMLAALHGFRCERIFQGESGRYLVVMQRKSRYT